MFYGNILSDKSHKHILRKLYYLKMFFLIETKSNDHTQMHKEKQTKQKV